MASPSTTIFCECLQSLSFSFTNDPTASLKDAAIRAYVLRSDQGVHFINVELPQMITRLSNTGSNLPDGKIENMRNNLARIVHYLSRSAEGFQRAVIERLNGIRPNLLGEEQEPPPRQNIVESHIPLAQTDLIGALDKLI